MTRVNVGTKNETQTNKTSEPGIFTTTGESIGSTRDPQEVDAKRYQEHKRFGSLTRNPSPKKASLNVFQDKLRAKLLPLNAEVGPQFKENIISDLKGRLNGANDRQDPKEFESVMELVKLAKEKGCFKGMDAQDIRARLLSAENYLGHGSPLANRARNLAEEIVK